MAGLKLNIVILISGAILLWSLAAMNRHNAESPSSVSTGNIESNPVAVLKTEPAETFSFESFTGAPEYPVVLKVSVWKATASNPCTAMIIGPGQSPQLDWLKRGVIKGFPDGRMGIDSEVISRCTGRFAYLDGSSGVPGTWAEFIGNDVESVVHSVRVKVDTPSRLIIELSPGKAPTPAQELARIQKLISDADQAVALKPQNERILQNKGRFLLELEKLKQDNATQH